VDDAGRNKLIINHLGKLFVTSDAATIIREIEVVHPAAKLLVMASEAQEHEVRASGITNVSLPVYLTRLCATDGRCHQPGFDPGWRIAEESGTFTSDGFAPK
jgi:hypothetical protein